MGEQTKLNWSKMDDKNLRRLVELYGISNWVKVAQQLEQVGKGPRWSAKQCRNRWTNHLNPNITKALWTQEEEQLLFAKQDELGNRWSKIAKSLPGRSDNQVKNHFYSILRKNFRKLPKAQRKQYKGTMSSILSKPDIAKQIVQIPEAEEVSTPIVNSSPTNESPKITEIVSTNSSPELELGNIQTWLLPNYETFDTMESMWKLPYEESH